MIDHETLALGLRLFDVLELLYIANLCLLLAVKIRRETIFGWSVGLFILSLGALFVYGAGAKISAPARFDLPAMIIRFVMAIVATVAYVATIRRMRGRS